jgi:hypothetical protein
MIKLSIEMVPETMWHNNVRSAVTSTQWNKIRKASYEKANYVCEICGGKGWAHPVECHEIWEYDDEAHTQTLKGMISLCPECHRVKHMGRTKALGDYDKAIEHLAEVNGWTKEEALIYVDGEFERWKQRSKSQWTLDISALASYLGGENGIKKKGKNSRKK